MTTISTRFMPQAKTNDYYYLAIPVYKIAKEQYKNNLPRRKINNDHNFKLFYKII